MVKLLTMFFYMSVFFQNAKAGVLDLEYLRKNYGTALLDEELCKSLIEELSADEKSSVHLAYLGAFQTIWANHAINPFSKLKTFNQGKKNIEKAVKSDPANIEIRFLRLSVQENCPVFLLYQRSIKEDRIYLFKNLHNITSPTLRKMAERLLNKL